MKALHLLVLAVASGCGEERAPAPTYHGDVRPILDRSCGPCHVRDGIAPFPVGSYEEARRHHREMAHAVRTGAMPPWPPAAGCAEYADDRSLQPREIATLVAWSEAGAPEGEPREVQGDAGITRVDLALEMAEPYTPSGQDDYRCFLLPWPVASARFVTGLQVEPGARAEVHHVIAFAAGPEQVAEYEALDRAHEGPGWECFGGPGGSGLPRWLGFWTPGQVERDLPAGLGLRMEPGARVVMQVHYNLDAAPPTPDVTSLLLRLETSVEREAAMLPWLDDRWPEGAMHIPAGEPEVVHTFAADPTALAAVLSRGAVPSGVALDVFSVGLHMHHLGFHTALHVERSSGERACLLDILRWDFHWQGAYHLRDPVAIHPGDAMRITCWFDNSGARGHGHPPRHVNWGDGTSDEMCIGAVLVAAR